MARRSLWLYPEYRMDANINYDILVAYVCFFATKRVLSHILIYNGNYSGTFHVCAASTTLSDALHTAQGRLRSSKINHDRFFDDYHMALIEASSLVLSYA